jgi:hypothetical protein
MDERYTFSSSRGVTATVYVAAGHDAPDSLFFTTEGKRIEFVRLSDRSLECPDAAGISNHCTSHDCHRAQLGKCQCGRHPGRVGFARAEPTTTIEGATQ